YYEDAELCRRLAAAGWKTFVSGEARLVHHESASFSDPFARLVLANRNRLAYALPELADPVRRAAFLDAESDYLRSSAPALEARAIGAAILEFLLRFGDFAARRAAGVPAADLRP